MSSSVTNPRAGASRRNGARALDVLLRYRGSVQPERFRALAALKALQAEAAAMTPVACLPPKADSTERTQSPR